jgi:hypothetical protein
MLFTLSDDHDYKHFFIKCLFGHFKHICTHLLTIFTSPLYRHKTFIHFLIYMNSPTYSGYNLFFKYMLSNLFLVLNFLGKVTFNEQIEFPLIFLSLLELLILVPCWNQFDYFQSYDDIIFIFLLSVMVLCFKFRSKMELKLLIILYMWRMIRVNLYLHL